MEMQLLLAADLEAAQLSMAVHWRYSLVVCLLCCWDCLAHEQLDEPCNMAVVQQMDLAACNLVVVLLVTVVLVAA